jgi:hypothetical protein
MVPAVPLSLDALHLSNHCLGAELSEAWHPFSRLTLTHCGCFILCISVLLSRLVTENGPATSTFDRLHKSYGGGSPEFLSLVISLAVETLILYPAIGAKWKEVKT